MSWSFDLLPLFVMNRARACNVSVLTLGAGTSTSSEPHAIEHIQGSTFMTIYIGNLSFQAEQEHLFDLFSEYGEVKNWQPPSRS